MLNAVTVAMQQKKIETVLIVCVKGGGRGACAKEREWIFEKLGGL